MKPSTGPRQPGPQRRADRQVEDPVRIHFSSKRTTLSIRVHRASTHRELRGKYRVILNKEKRGESAETRLSTVTSTPPCSVQTICQSDSRCSLVFHLAFPYNLGMSASFSELYISDAVNTGPGFRRGRGHLDSPVQQNILRFWNCESLISVFQICFLYGYFKK